jgi:mannose-1-phosphate guanylyltransferase
MLAASRCVISIKRCSIQAIKNAGAQFRYASSPTKQRPYLPNVSNKMEEPVYVLTLSTSPELHDAMDRLRNKYYPAELNKVGAHLTLFHALPESKMDDIISGIRSVTQATSAYEVEASHVWSTNSIVAIKVHHHTATNDTERIHATLRSRWANFLSKQDSGKVKLHYTLMGKVRDKEMIEAAFKEIRDQVEGREIETRGMATGLTLWKYRRGYWESPNVFPFATGM